MNVRLYIDCECGLYTSERDNNELLSSQPILNCFSITVYIWWSRLRVYNVGICYFSYSILASTCNSILNSEVYVNGTQCMLKLLKQDIFHHAHRLLDSRYNYGYQRIQLLATEYPQGIANNEAYHQLA